MVVSLGLEALGNLSTDEGNRARLGAAHACARVVSLMNTLNKSPSVVQQGCRALARLAVGRDNIKYMNAVNSCETIVNSMKLHSTYVGVCHQGCNAIKEYARHGINQKKLLEAGACEMVVLCLRSHSSSVALCRQGSAAIHLLAQNTANNVRLGQCGACEILVDLLRLHLMELAVVECLSAAISSLSALSAESRSLLGNRGVCELLSLALGQHFESEGVTEWVFRAVNNLLYESPSNVTRLGTGGFVEHLSKAVSRHINQTYIAATFCSIIDRLCRKEEQNRLIIGTMTDRNICKLVIKAMSVHEECESVAYYGCCAIASLSYDNYKNQSLLGSAGACRAVVIALQRHDGTETERQKLRRRIKRKDRKRRVANSSSPSHSGTGTGTVGTTAVGAGPVDPMTGVSVLVMNGGMDDGQSSTGGTESVRHSQLQYLMDSSSGDGDGPGLDDSASKHIDLSTKGTRRERRKSHEAEATISLNSSMETAEDMSCDENTAEGIKSGSPPKNQATVDSQQNEDVTMDKSTDFDDTVVSSSTREEHLSDNGMADVPVPDQSTMSSISTSIDETLTGNQALNTDSESVSSGLDTVADAKLKLSTNGYLPNDKNEDHIPNGGTKIKVSSPDNNTEKASNTQYPANISDSMSVCSDDSDSSDDVIDDIDVSGDALLMSVPLWPTSLREEALRAIEHLTASHESNRQKMTMAGVTDNVMKISE